MTNNLEVGQIITGKVTGIQPYGAFVTVSDNIQGLVHISEVTNGFVNDINEHLNVGDEVNVKIIQIDEASNKISLSIRATEEPAAASAEKTTNKKAPKLNPVEEESPGFHTLKDKLEDWLKQSTEREKLYKN
ncbi:S1 domain-containing post-transcriptional regulator GSP13 [Virgibacillus sp. W0430]|uniref:S1 domain-containing post-transcriptional regulator GSP13 n=1 Tax=Virgibacillus sp. W0430 TaxID=3391580 RepID=UPI003F45C00C